MAEHLQVVAAALVHDGTLLSCRRVAPPELAGFWEFPGGKVEPGESDAEALVRECSEELGLAVLVGEQVGDELAFGDVRIRVYWCELSDAGDGEPVVSLRDHDAARWLRPGELDEVPWLEVDLGLVAEIGRRLRTG